MDDDGHALEVVEKWKLLPNSLGHAFEFVEKWVPDSLGHTLEFVEMGCGCQIHLATPL